MIFFEKLKNIAKKQFFLKIVVPFAALLMLLNAVTGLFSNPKREVIEVPSNVVSLAPFASSVSGLGVTEPKSEIINIGTNISGIVAEIYAVAGDKVKKGDRLFTVDNREAKANFELKLAQAEAAKLDAKEKMYEFAMYKKIEDKRAYSADEFNKKKIAAQIYEQKARQAKAESEMARVMLDKLTIKSPITGEVLKVDIRLGEYAQAGVLSRPLMMLGDLEKMHVRVEIDEVESGRVRFDHKAVAYLRGQPEIKIPLEFVRVEPYIVPKISISGGNAEKIDTRVMQMIYSFDNAEENKILVGQQMDVYIEVASPAAPINSETKE